MGRVVITGCSGGGKSTLLEALAARGFAVVPEPGRRIVREEMARGGTALPWLDMAGFARRAMEVAKADLASAPGGEGWIFFDRGLIDAAVALSVAASVPLASLLPEAPVYFRTVFIAPPWEDIYVADAQRPHGFVDAVKDYERLRDAYLTLGYDLVELPKIGVEARAAFLLTQLGAP